jgi:hypothetical protein
MLQIIKRLLLQIVDNIDSGNSNTTEEQEIEIIELIKRFTDREERLSKYQACEYLRVRRPTFDSYIREGKLSRGKKVAGFKELSWSKKELDDYIIKYKPKRK